MGFATYLTWYAAVSIACHRLLAEMAYGTAMLNSHGKRGTAPVSWRATALRRFLDVLCIQNHCHLVRERLDESVGVCERVVGRFDHVSIGLLRGTGLS